MSELIKKLQEVEAYLFNREMEDYSNVIGEIIQKIEWDEQKLKIEVEVRFEAMMLDPLCGGLNDQAK